MFPLIKYMQISIPWSLCTKIFFFKWFFTYLDQEAGSDFCFIVSEPSVLRCVHCFSLPMFYLLNHVNLKNTEFANLSYVKRKNIEDNMCHTDLREAFTSNLFLVISRSWPVSGADMDYWDVWQTCHLRVRNIWTYWIMAFYKFLTLKKKWRLIAEGGSE